MSKAIEYFSDKYNLSYDSAIKNTKEHVDSLNTTKTELADLKSQTEDYKSTLLSLGEKYSIDLEGLDTVDDILNKIKSSDAKLELVDQVEIGKIENANSALERQISIKEKLSQSQQKEAAYDARDTLNRGKQSVAKKVAQFVPGGKKVYQQDVGNVNIVDAVKEDIYAIQKYENEIADLEKSMSNLDPTSKEWKQAEKDIKSYNDAIEELTSDLNDKEIDLSDLLTATSVNGDGLEALKGFEDEFKEIKSAFDVLNNIDLSPAEQQLNALNSFFDGSAKSNAIKDRIKDMINTGEVDNATDALHKMGLTLNDLGVTGEGKKTAFDDYFSGLISSAKEAESAIKSIDGSVAGVKSAFESENQDADWNSMADYLKQAQELYKNGKVGTDDFKAATQFMSPELINPDSTKYDADAYVAAWEAAQNKVKRYFDSENPANSVYNFTNDLVNKGLADNDRGDITWKFKTSAEAAKALGLSVEAAEVAMHNLESYGAEFDNVMFSGEGLTRYEGALNGIKSLYDSMSEGESKNRLKDLIEGWDSELEGYQNDLSTLTEDQIVHIEFEYDLASIQAQIDELTAAQKASGGKDAVTNASVIATNEKYLSTAKKGLGLNNEGIDLSVRFKPVEDAIDSLYSQLQDSESGSDEFFEIQAKIQNTQELQKDLFNSFSEQHPEITANSNIDEITNAWESFFGQEQHLTVEGELDTGSIEAQMESLASGSTIKFTADVNGDEREVTALKNVDGTISYTSNIDGVDVPVSVTEKDGTVTFKADTKEVDAETAKTDGGTRTTNYKANTSGLPSSFAPITRTVNYVASGVNVVAGVAAGAAVASKAGAVIKGKNNGTLLSPAKSNGTAYNALNLKPAYANGKVALTKDEDALVNELGTESIVRDGEWKLLPGKMHIQSLKKGDIVLNAEQTKDLLNSGKTNSHARAYVNGTLMNAYANGWRIPTGVKNNSSYSSTVNTKKTTSSANRASGAVSSAANATKDALDALTGYFDWVAVNMTRAARLSEIAENAIDTAIGLSAKQANTEEAIRKVQNEIDIARRGADRYLSHANWFAGQSGLSADLQSRVQNGTIDISKYDDDTKKKIEEYQDWWIHANVKSI